jgi:hypothetical protein
MSEILKKWIGINQVDETIIRLNNNASLRARNQANSADINLFHLNTSNIMQLDVALNAGGFAITNLPTPVNPGDAATMSYVTSTISGSAANQTLSNLTSPTAINQNLLPATDATYNLGSTSESWQQANVHKLLDSSGNTSVQVYSRTLNDTSGSVVSVDFGNRNLKDSGGATQLSWSTSGVNINQLSAVLNANSFKITNLANGTATNDAVTYGQLENALAGISFRPAVALYDNVDTTPPTSTSTPIDGVTVTNGMRVLFVNLSSGNNEVYQATVVVTAITWAAQDDNDRGNPLPVTGDTITVLQGTTYGGSQWTYNGTIFTQTNGANQIQPGTAMSKSGNTLNVLYDGSTIALNGSNQLYVPAAGITTTQIAASSVTLNQMANLAANRIIGNNTGSPTAPIALTETQVTAMLNLFTSSLQGLTPASGGGTSNFLRADGTWAAPSGTGVSSITINSTNGFAGTSSGGTTPALTISTTVTGILYGNGTSVAAAVAGNFPTLNQSTTGTAANVTATSNSTITTLSALSLPFSQLSGQATLAQLPSIANDTVLGNVAGSTTTPTALTQTQLTTLINSFTSSLSGAAPASGGGTTNFLRADGTWAAPGSGATWQKDLYVITSTNVTNQYLDLSYVALTNSINFMIEGAATQVEGSSYDYTVSYTGGAGGVTRITFQNGLATGGASPLSVGDVVVVQYQH